MIIMNKIKRLNACTRPLTGTERKAIAFVNGPSNKIKFENGNVVDDVFRGGNAFVNPKAVTI